MGIDSNSGARDEFEVDWADLLDDEPKTDGGGPSQRVTAPPAVPAAARGGLDGAAHRKVTTPTPWDDATPTRNHAVPPASFGSDPRPEGVQRGGIGIDFDDADRPTTPAASPGGLGLGLDFSSDGDALDLVGARAGAPIAPASKGPDVEMRDRFAVGDFSGALVMAEAILEGSPRDPEAQRIAGKCRDVLKQMYISRLGGMGGVPRLSLSGDKVKWLSLDHKAGFLLSRVDGFTSVEEILDVSGMPALEALRILFELSQQNVIRVS